MKIEVIPGARTAARRRAGQFQRTFQTPLDRLPAFTDILLPDDSAVRSGAVFVETVVFEPARLLKLLTVHGLGGVHVQGATITADGPSDCRALLTAALGDSIDFYFMPEPKQFLLYADHDEYVTVFTHKKGPLSQIADGLAAIAVKEVAGFERSL